MSMIKKHEMYFIGKDDMNVGVGRGLDSVMVTMNRGDPVPEAIAWDNRHLAYDRGEIYIDDMPKEITPEFYQRCLDVNIVKCPPPNVGKPDEKIDELVAGNPTPAIPVTEVPAAVDEKEAKRLARNAKNRARRAAQKADVKKNPGKLKPSTKRG